jgi:hypothetical protein
MTLDRENNDGNYEPGNCRWVTRTEQNRNARGCKLTVEVVREIRGIPRKDVSIKALAKKHGLSSSRISCIRAGHGWPDVN